MDTESVRLFVLAAEYLNISKAGQAMGILPAAASGKLAKLEKRLGVELLHRSTRKVALSTEGEEFLPYAKELLAQEAAALMALGHGQLRPSGTLRFAASSTFAQMYILPLIPKFHEKFPDIKLDLRLSDSQFDLIEGSFDLALRIQNLKDSSLKARLLGEDKRVLCAAPAYLSEHGSPLEPEDLLKHQLIAFRGQTARPLKHESGSSVAKKAWFDPQASDCRLVLDDGLSQKIATIAGAGVSINSLWSVRKELQNGDLVRVLPDYEVDEGTAIWLVYPKSNVLTAKVRAFIDFLVAEIS